MILRIRGTPSFNQDTFDRSGEWLDVEENRLELDLSRCLFFDGYCMATLLTIPPRQ